MHCFYFFTHLFLNVTFSEHVPGAGYCSSASTHTCTVIVLYATHIEVGELSMADVTGFSLDGNGRLTEWEGGAWKL